MNSCIRQIQRINGSSPTRLRLAEDQLADCVSATLSLCDIIHDGLSPRAVRETGCGVQTTELGGERTRPSRLSPSRDIRLAAKVTTPVKPLLAEETPEINRFIPALLNRYRNSLSSKTLRRRNQFPPHGLPPQITG